MREIHAEVAAAPFGAGVVVPHDGEADFAAQAEDVFLEEVGDAIETAFMVERGAAPPGIGFQGEKEEVHAVFNHG